MILEFLHRTAIGLLWSLIGILVCWLCQPRPRLRFDAFLLAIGLAIFVLLIYVGQAIPIYLLIGWHKAATLYLKFRIWLKHNL